jgi:UDP-3-O-[3-hydroxymyristoyl] glucosamine N-acyltransferase
MAVSLGELAVRFGCELRGDPELRIERVGTLSGADPGALAFLANSRYRSQLAGTRAGAVVLSEASAAACPSAMLVCENPYAIYARIAAVLYPLPPLVPGVHASATVADSARLDRTAQVCAGAVIGAGVTVGARVYVGPHSILEADVVLAQDVRLSARVTLCRGVRIGARSVLQPGVVIGGDGFGFAAESGGFVKVPQVGSVAIGADVEIGANTTIDRGAIEDTVLEDGVKIDNLVMIGHNVRIGAHTVIAGCTGVSGSTVIGRRCMIGGAVGIAGHISIADDVVLTGTSTVGSSIAKPGVYSSTITVEEARTWRRLVGRFKRSASVEARLRRLEQATGVSPAAESEDHD